jgi:hypothetical protein
MHPVILYLQVFRNGDATMKRTAVFLIFFVVIFLGVSILYAQVGRAPSGLAGNFELLAGQYTIVGDKASAESFGVFRIDTRTGKTWELRNDVRIGHAYSGWFEVSEPPVRPK